jgi:thymidylate synthase (FAD)
MQTEACSVELLETFGSDLTVVNAARVSLGKEVSEFTEKDARLIRYLANHDHISPFFHPQARFRIKMPIWMAREWYRHTVGFARNEVSRRYVDDAPTFHLPEAVRTRAANKKQGSNDDVHPKNDDVLSLMRQSFEEAVVTYDVLLSEGVPPEQARIVLPQSMMTEFIETGSLAAYARLVKLRTSPDAQAEIHAVARMVSDCLATKFPASWPVLVQGATEAAAGASTS